ncbi:hypothetical protein NJB1907Z4_C43640 [Mycobacterium pseudoshottsii]|uniref:Uncharacterized protein n=1 Tax=Mycobacterium pseudoshottsii TaxID=265949 RepID=A0A9N7LYD4_9MYCO|nr:hypothetical protein NJB1907Z4_C43640 [Mycobacterium pseudoshottsii]
MCAGHWQSARIVATAGRGDAPGPAHLLAPLPDDPLDATDGKGKWQALVAPHSQFIGHWGACGKTGGGGKIAGQERDLWELGVAKCQSRRRRIDRETGSNLWLTMRWWLSVQDRQG